jgi:hypothetical protein
MNADKQTEELFTAEETSHNENDDALPSDDNLEVEFGDPRLMGDLFDLFVDAALSQFNEDQLVDWVAGQLRIADQRVKEAQRIKAKAAKLRQSLEELRDILPESPSQNSNLTTHN